MLTSFLLSEINYLSHMHFKNSLAGINERSLPVQQLFFIIAFNIKLNVAFLSMWYIIFLYEINVHKIMIFQLVTAVHMDLPPKHVVQVVSVLVNQILLEQSVHHVILGITTIPIATVRFTVKGSAWILGNVKRQIEVLIIGIF